MSASLQQITPANMIHKVFELTQVVEKLPLVIECMACYDNKLILGINSGRILIYQLDINQLVSQKLDVTLDMSISATKKPIQQLEAIQRFNILIALFDSQLHIFDLEKFHLQNSIAKTKGSTLFATSESKDGKLLRLCVASRKRLQFFYTLLPMNGSKSTGQFMELTSDLELNDTPRTMEFTKDDLIVFSMKKDYFYYELNTNLGATTAVSVSSSSSSNNLQQIGANKQLEARFSTGTRLLDPLCQKLHNDFIALGVDDNKTIIYDSKGKPYLEYPIIWSTSPSIVCSVGYYLIGILPSSNCAEIVTIEPDSMSAQIVDFGSALSPMQQQQQQHHLGQQLERGSSNSLSSSASSSFFNSAMAPVLSATSNFLTSTNTSVPQTDRLKILQSNGNSVCYIATQQNVYCLTAIKINEQLEQAIRYKNYELGLNLIASQKRFNQTPTWYINKRKNDDKVNPKEKIPLLAPFFSLKPMYNDIDDVLDRKIQSLNALNEFCVKKKFSDALHLFQLMKTDPSHLIAFIPGLLPDAYRTKLRLDEYYPTLSPIEMADAISSLIDYLQFKRNEVLKENKPLNDPTNFSLIPLIDGRPVLKTRTQLLQIIDTTLLKCYLKTNDSLVPFFLRRENSFLHLEESERLLLQHNKMSELIILYEKKEEHVRALDLLITESTKMSSPLYGQKFLIKYLKKIGNKNLNLIFKYAKNAIEMDAESGLQIFMDNSIEMDDILLKRATAKQNIKKSNNNNNSISRLKVNGGGGGSENGIISFLSQSQSQSQSQTNDSKSLNRQKGSLSLRSVTTPNNDMILDEDEEILKSLDHTAVYTFLDEQIEPKDKSDNLVRIYLQVIHSNKISLFLIKKNKKLTKIELY
jgi:hypothetical protein